MTKKMSRKMARKKKPLPKRLVDDLAVIPMIKHCDEYIDDPTAPEVLRTFLAFARAPAHGQLLPKPHPTLFADHEGTRVRVTMASRFGDVGISTDFTADVGYDQRVPVSQLANFSTAP